MSKHPKPPAHPVAAFLAVGSMSVLVAGVLHRLGLSRGVDRAVEGWVEGIGLEGPMKDLPLSWLWVWTVLIAYGLAAGMLISRRHWRRTVLWVTTVLLTLSWIPVLALAGFAAPAGLPLLAVLWCGVCAMIYAIRHEEPGDLH